MKKIILSLLCLIAFLDYTSAQQRWRIKGRGITWQVKPGDIPHRDHIEMSGLKVSTVVRYGVEDNGSFYLNRGMVWPTLRTIPNNTHASLMRKMEWNPLENVLLNHEAVEEQVESISLDGTICTQSICNTRKGNIQLTRIMFPSTSQPAFYEKYILKNISDKSIPIEISNTYIQIKTPAQRGVNGSYRLVQKLQGNICRELRPTEEAVFYVSTTGYKQEEKEVMIDIESELTARQELIEYFLKNLVVETPDPIINMMFAFAKIRGTESIYETAGGLLHGPGGESYYAAIWANDQAEYINPFFPYLGYKIGNQSALNSYMHFARFMNDEYKPLPSSIIAEGTDIWGGAGDRGDAAMIAYGAARYALSRGDKAEAEQLWPLIEWCLEYCKRQINSEGVVASDSDELEGRFPAGDANLCTSSLYYDALNSAVYLGKELKKAGKQLKAYANEAKTLKKNINRYFSTTVEGFDTYQYYQGNDVLRAWICIPLTVNIYDRKEGTIQALFSPRLWTENGLLTQAGSNTFWDRSTLYALRGVYACGETEKATNYLKFYSAQRLLGEHVPYAIEAWPEGDQRHLSAESGLYCRVITEGMFGIRPTGFKSFTLTPRLPQEWEYMNLNQIKAFGTSLDIQIQRIEQKLDIRIFEKGKLKTHKRIREGETLPITIL
jgi:hypothetical protein